MLANIKYIGFNLKKNRRLDLYINGVPYGGNIIRATLHLITSIIFFKAWRVPDLYGSDTLENLMFVMLIEFLTVHAVAGLIITSLQGNNSYSILFVLLYIGIAALFSGSLNKWWPLISFTWFLFAKLYGLSQSEKGEKPHADEFKKWRNSTTAFIGISVFFTALPVPQWGITAAIKKAQGLTESGLWYDHPERVMAMGTIYFIVLCLMELLSPIKKMSGIIIKPFRDGRKCYTFKMGRNMSTSFLIFFALLGLIGLTILLLKKNLMESFGFLLMLVPIDITLFISLIINLFEKRSMKIDKDSVLLKGGIFGIGPRRKINFQNIMKISQHSSGKMEGQMKDNICLLTKTGKKYLIVRNVGQGNYLSELIEDMIATLEKLGWKDPNRKTKTTIQKEGSNDRVY